MYFRVLNYAIRWIANIVCCTSCFSGVNDHGPFPENYSKHETVTAFWKLTMKTFAARASVLDGWSLLSTDRKVNDTDQSVKVSCRAWNGYRILNANHEDPCDERTSVLHGWSLRDERVNEDSCRARALATVSFNLAPVFFLHEPPVDGLDFPFCSTCDNRHGACHYCRKISWYTPPAWD